MTNDDRIDRVLSPARFAPYVKDCGGDRPAAFRLYLWHVDVAAAFYSWLHWLEIPLRNSLHDRLAAHFDRGDWWDAAPLNYWGSQKRDIAKHMVARRPGGVGTADDVVAELPLGFWVSLLASRYDRALWVPTLHRAFPHYRGRRDTLHGSLKPLPEFRNRVMHHETVHRHDLAEVHASIRRVIGYIDPGLLGLLDSRDRLADLLRKRPSAAGSTEGTR